MNRRRDGCFDVSRVGMVMGECMGGWICLVDCRDCGCISDEIQGVTSEHLHGISPAAKFCAMTTGSYVKSKRSFHEMVELF